MINRKIFVLILMLILCNYLFNTKVIAKESPSTQPSRDSSSQTPNTKDKYSHKEIWKDLNKKTIQLYRAGKYDDAKKCAYSALKLAEKAFGKEDLKTAISLNNLAEICVAQGLFLKAEPLYKKALAIKERVLGKEHLDTAISIYNLAKFYQQQGRFSDSETLYFKVLKIFEKKLGKNHPKVAMILNNLGLIYSDRGLYSKAELTLKRALAISEKKFGEKHISVSQSLYNLATLYFDQGRYSEAEKLFKRSLNICEEKLGKNHINNTFSLDFLAQIYCIKGLYSDAELLYERSLSIKQKTFGKDHYRIAASFSKIANLYSKTGNYRKAETLHKKALGIMEKTFGKNHRYLATCFNNLSCLYQEMGCYEKAESFYKRSLSINKKNFGKNHPSVATVLANLSSLYCSQARYSEAESLCTESLKIRKKIHGLNHPDTVNSLNNLTVIYFHQGRISSAINLSKKSLMISKEIYNEGNPIVINLLNNQSIFYCIQGNYSKAEQICKKALLISEKNLGKNNPLNGSILNNLSAIYYFQDRFSEAKYFTERAIEICKINFGVKHPYVATSINNLARLHHVQGNYSDAENLFKKSLKIRKEILGNEHLDVSQSLNNLAGLLAANNKGEEGFPLMNEAIQIEEKVIFNVFCTSSEKQKFQFLKTIHKNYEGFLSLINRELQNNPQALISGLDAVFKRKGIVLDAISKERELILNSSKPEVRNTYKKLYEITSMLSSLTLAGPGKMKTELYRKRLNELRTEREKLEKKLTELSSEYAIKKRTRLADCKTVSKKLPSGSVLVEYVNIRPYNFKAKGTENKWGEPEYFAFVLPSSKDVPKGEKLCPKLVSLGKASQIDNAIEEYRKDIKRAQRLWKDRILDEKEAEIRLAKKGKHLYELGVAPVKKAIGESKTLYIAPDGDLNLIPFDALQDETGQYLIEKYKINYLSSGRDLIGYDRKISKTGKTIIIADPDYNLSGSDRMAASKKILTDKKQKGETEEFALRGERRSRDLSLTKWNRLPGTRKEAEEITRILKDDNPKYYNGKTALEEVFKKIRNPYRLHIATHGFFMEDQDDKEFLKAGIEGQTMMSKDGAFSGVPIKIENPLLRSGLILTGANKLGKEKLPEGCEDGILTALEITGIPMFNTDLVVLSACETGVGKTKCGEGVFGLRRAFQLAGARTVVMSLWSVPDKQTQEMMVDYYKRLKSGESKSEALRNTKLSIIKSRRQKNKTAHPFFWASFISVGEP